MNMSIGQGWTLVTPLQMANIAAMAVNAGALYTPHILKEVRDPRTGAVETTVAPSVLQKSSVDKSVFAAVRRDMRGVISEGTAVYPMNIRAVEIAGKTGTSEVGLEDRWHAWFTSFAPYETDNPEERVVVAVIVEAVNEWEWWAVYCSAIIYQGIFANQTYEEASRTLGMRNTQPISGYRE
jgi:penicillin-binding protein 2